MNETCDRCQAAGGRRRRRVCAVVARDPAGTPGAQVITDGRDAVRSVSGGGVRGLGELEAAIVERVWSAGRPVLVREIHDGLRPEREPAYNTGLTVVEILSRKGWLAKETAALLLTAGAAGLARAR